MKQILASVLLFLALAYPTYSQSPVPSAAPEVVYEAPKINLLPDSPLYKFRLVLDRLSLTLSSRPYVKARKYVLLADRELTSALKLLEKGNDSLALHTAFRGEHYMTLFVNTLKAAAYATGTLDLAVTKLAHDAYSYHQQVIQSMVAKTSGQTQEELKKILEFSQRNDYELTLLEQEYKLTP